jgi:hypothetical protein
LIQWYYIYHQQGYSFRRLPRLSFHSLCRNNWIGRMACRFVACRGIQYDTCLARSWISTCVGPRGYKFTLGKQHHEAALTSPSLSCLSATYRQPNIVYHPCAIDRWVRQVQCECCTSCHADERFRFMKKTLYISFNICIIPIMHRWTQQHGRAIPINRAGALRK